MPNDYKKTRYSEELTCYQSLFFLYHICLYLYHICLYLSSPLSLLFSSSWRQVH